MKMKRLKSAVLVGVLVSIPLMAGGCKKAPAPDDGAARGGRVSSTGSRAGTYSARSVKRAKRGSTIMGGGSLSAGSSLTGGSSTRGPETGAAPSRRSGF